uniref:Tetratricopeptide repeat protein 38 n=1 Tax=Caenorhabditis japonica TaxID=281687 RepID=A0A8R1DZ77_CAEJA
MARAFVVGLTGLGTEAAARDIEFAKKMTRLELDAEQFGNEREKRHVKAAVLWGRGKHHEAAATWDRLLDDYPTDLIAVKFSHDAHFFNGSSSGKRNAVEKVIGKWNADLPCYSYLHGMYAFGLEECGEYAQAEVEAEHALALNRFDCWASHAKAHVLEMNGRHREGKEFMYNTEDDWRQGWMLATHNYWHTALFHIEFAEHESALEIFDREVANRFNRTNSLLDMVDASSLLWRLELEGVNVGKERWRKIENLGKYIDNHSIVFNDVHLGVALYRQGELETENELRSSLDKYSSLLSEDNAQISKTIGMPLYDGMLNFAHGNYDTAAEKMLPIRDKVVQIGGSHAQRDMFVQTLIQSCILSKDANIWSLTPRLIGERETLKHDSLLGQRLAEKFRAMHPL